MSRVFFRGLVVAMVLAAPAGAQAWHVVMETVAGGNSNVYEIYPLKRSDGTGGFYSATDYYSYGTPNPSAANTPDGLEQSQTAKIFFHDSPTDGLVLFFIADVPNDGSGGQAVINLTSDLAGEGLSLLVVDDPGSGYTWDDTTGSGSTNLNWTACCTDGWVLGSFPTDRHWSMQFTFSALNNLTSFDIETLDGCQEDGGTAIASLAIPASSINSLTFYFFPDTAADTCGAGALVCPAPETCTAFPEVGGVPQDEPQFGLGGAVCPYDDLPDGTACTTDPCTVGSTCTAQVCGGGAPLDCSGLDSACASARCDATGQCVADPINESGVCDDGDACTSNDACTAGLCGGPGVDCSGLDSTCAAGTCNPTTGVCEAAPANSGSSCDDGDACTTTDLCVGVSCTGSPMDCTQLDTTCAVGACNADSGACEAAPANSGASCDDGDACTTTDLCVGTSCTGNPVDCSQLDATCAVGACNADSGACEAAPANSGASCDDGDMCTTTDLCVGVSCTGSSVDCSQLDATCAVGTCNATTGACEAAPANSGASCDDGDMCTTTDLCVGVSCTGSSVDCTQLDSTCSIGVCDGTSGSCVAQAINEDGVCDDGDACTTTDLCVNASCTGNSVDCTQLDTTCSTGVCDGANGSCVAQAINENGVCDDGDACTADDVCSAGACQGGGAPDCSHLDDGCRTGVCEPNTGTCVADEPATGCPPANGDPSSDPDANGCGCSARQAPDAAWVMTLGLVPLGLRRRRRHLS